MNCAPGVHLPGSIRPHCAVGARAPHPPVLLRVYRGEEEPSRGFPTTNYGCDCDLLCPPFYFNNCNYNGAVAVLQQMVSSVANGTVHDPPGFEGTLSTFDQEEFFDGDAEAMSRATIGQRSVEMGA